MKNPIDFKEYFFTHPFGSLTKRELELKLLQYAISHSIVTPTAHSLAKDLKIAMTKAHSYLTDLALREEPITADEALKLFINSLQQAEVVATDNYLQFSPSDTRLRLWIERELSALSLLQGESIKKEIIKLTPKAVVSILEHHKKLPSNKEAKFLVQKEFSDTHWYKQIKENSSKTINYLEFFNTSADALKHLLSAVALGI